MARKISLTAADGHVLDAWRADPAGAAKGGVVVLHAIFGLTTHMGSVCDEFAADGYAAIAPALYDRDAKNRVFGYDPDGMKAGFAQRQKLTEPTVQLDVEACIAALRPAGRVAVLGFCTGGSWAWLMAARTDVDAAVIYYGSHLYAMRDLTPRCPAILHYGDNDTVVPMPHVEAIRAAYPSLPFHIYPGAQHAFYNPDQASHDAEAARLGRARTLAFLAEQIAPRSSAA